MIRTQVNPALKVTYRNVKIPGGYVGFAHQDEGLIEIDPRQSEREYLLTLCHEWLHILLPTVSERNICRIEKSLGGMLWRRGYRLKKKRKRAF